MKSPPTNAIILAAGMGERIGGPKALLELEGQTLLERMVSLLSWLPLNQITCVINQTIQEKIQDLATIAVPRSGDLLTVVNNDLDTGPLRSIQIGLEAFEKRNSNVLIMPVDFPFIKPSTIRLLLETINPGRVNIPVYQGKRGHPPVFGSKLIPQLWKAPLDKGARWIYQALPDKINHIETDDEGILQNVNTPEDWQKWTKP